MSGQILNKYNTLKINDLFGVIHNEDESSNTSINHLKYILSDTTDNLIINWSKMLYDFYIDSIKFNNNEETIIINCITNILSNNKFDHINRFLYLNNLFQIINDLNASYNQSVNYKNYTLLRCQEYYLENIIKENNKNQLETWFNLIIKSNLNSFYDMNITSKKSKNEQTIELLSTYIKNYFDNYTNNEIRSNLIKDFINRYIIWTNNYLAKQYTLNKINLLGIIDKLDKIKKINEILFTDTNDQIFYYNEVIKLTIPFWTQYLNNVLINNIAIDDYIVDVYSKVKLSDTQFENITLDFVIRWYDNIKSRLNIKHFTKQLFNDLRKISPLILLFNNGINKSEKIIDIFVKIFDIESKLQLLVCIITGLNIIIKNIYNNNLKSNNYHLLMNQDIINSIELIKLFKNKEDMWNEYFKITYNRLLNILKKYRLSTNIINFELSIFYHLNQNNCQKFSNKNKLLLNNLKINYYHILTLQKIKINYVDSNGEQIHNLKHSDINKVDYIVLDKHNTDNDNMDKQIVLLNPTVYPQDIKNYIAVGKTYYNLVSETKILYWNIENSTINFNILNTTIISNIIQFTMLSIINQKDYTKDNLISNIMNNEDSDNIKKYLESYIENLINENLIISNNDNYLIINKNKFKSNNTIDISNFIPYLKSTIKSIENKQIDNIQEDNFKITQDCTNYLRLCLLVKMFKTNSTVKYSINNIIYEFHKFINNYINKNPSLECQLKTNLKNLTNISEKELQDILQYIEKRDIIEIDNYNKY